MLALIVVLGVLRWRKYRSMLLLVLVAEELAEWRTLRSYLPHEGRLKLNAFLTLHLFLSRQGTHTVPQHFGVID